jgi:uncharacterized protein (DUF2267 family)
MSITGLDVFDSTVHQTNAWLKAIMGRLGTEDRHRAYLALRTTLQALRDRLQPEMAVHLGAQLPMLVRGVYYEDWHMAGTPTRERHKEEFLAHVATAFSQGPRDRPRAHRAGGPRNAGRKHRPRTGQQDRRRAAARAAGALVRLEKTGAAGGKLIRPRSGRPAPRRAPSCKRRRPS